MTDFRFPYPGAIALALLAALLSGCAAMRPDSILRTGPGLDFDSKEVKTFRENQDEVLSELFHSAGLDKEKQVVAANLADVTLETADWAKVINAGMDYADQRCEAYMSALVRLNRDKTTLISQLGLVGTAAAGVLAAASAAAKEVAVTAILFGLGASTVENYSSNLLYDMEPSSVRSLVKGLQKAYRGALPSPLDYDSRPGAVAVIRGYAALCTPANIEAEVNLAVKKAQPDSQKGDGANGQPPSVSHNLSVASVTQIKDAERINLAVAALIKDTTKLAEINRILQEVKASTADITDFQQAARALDRAFRDMKSDETQKWLKALRL